jgi:hypothetical protein
MQSSFSSLSRLLKAREFAKLGNSISARAKQLSHARRGHELLERCSIEKASTNKFAQDFNSFFGICPRQTFPKATGAVLVWRIPLSPFGCEQVS